MVIVSEDSARSEWQLARVVKVTAGSDGLVRKVKIRLQDSILERPIKKLVLLVENE